MIETIPLQVREAEETGNAKFSVSRSKPNGLEKWLNENDPEYGTQGQKISSNLTDNESAAEAHGVIQGYKSQTLIYGKHQVMFMSRSSAGVRTARLRTASATRR